MQTERVFNFSAGPAVLPETVLQQVGRDMVSLPGVGSSILEVSHRGPVFMDFMDRAQRGLRNLLEIPDDYEVLFLQGGSRLQFGMIPLNFQTDSDTQAAYVVTGSWGRQAYAEADRLGHAIKIWDGEGDGFHSIPQESVSVEPSETSYLYYVSNETIQGVQFPAEPDFATTATGGSIPLICDASSDLLCRPVDVSKFGMIYACAQKNAGPAGLTIVVARKDLIERGSGELAGYLQYRSHADNQSLFNTPPTFAIYVLALVVEWLQNEIGGLDQMLIQNRRKADLLYDIVDRFPHVYQSHASPEARSLMNVVFRFENPDRQASFLEQAASKNLTGLAGHRSVGGIRASIYNAMPMTGVAALAEFMEDFAKSS